MDRQSQIIDLSADDEIQRIDRCTEKHAVRCTGVIDHDVLAAASAIRIRIVAAQPRQYIVSTITTHHVVRSIAGSVDRCRSDQRQIFEIGAQRIRDAALHGIGSRSRIFHEGISGPDHIRIIAGPAGEHVGRAVASQHIIQCVTCPVDGRRTDQRQVLEISAQCPGDGTLDRIDTGIRLLGHGIAGADDIRIIAGPAGQHVSAAVTGEDVIQRVTRAIDRRRAHQRQIFHVRAQDVGERALHRVNALIRILRHRIPGIIDDIGVVASSA